MFCRRRKADNLRLMDFIRRTICIFLNDSKYSNYLHDSRTNISCFFKTTYTLDLQQESMLLQVSFIKQLTLA